MQIHCRQISPLLSLESIEDIPIFDKTFIISVSAINRNQTVLFFFHQSIGLPTRIKLPVNYPINHIFKHKWKINFRIQRTKTTQRHCMKFDMNFGQAGEVMFFMIFARIIILSYQFTDCYFFRISERRDRL